MFAAELESCVHSTAGVCIYSQSINVLPPIHPVLLACGLSRAGPERAPNKIAQAATVACIRRGRARFPVRGAHACARPVHPKAPLQQGYFPEPCAIFHVIVG